MNRSRLWSLVLTLSLLTLSIAGCGSSAQQPSTTPSASGGSAPPKTEPAQSPIKLVSAHVIGSVGGDIDGAGLDSLDSLHVGRQAAAAVDLHDQAAL